MPDSSYAVIGAGPSGLATARNLQRRGIPWVGYELGDDVGGLWNIDGPRSTVYESAHLISSKRTTEFAEYPMGDAVADYPSHRELLAYFRDSRTTSGCATGSSSAPRSCVPSRPMVAGPSRSGRRRGSGPRSTPAWSSRTAR